MKKIVIDIYGADAGVAPVLDGVAKALHAGIGFFPVMVGQADLICEAMDRAGIAPDRYEIIDTDKFIRNEDPPNCIFGGCDDTSMAMAYGKLKADEDCFAMLSAGSTGALLVGSICRLGLLKGLRFPVLASALPCCGKPYLCLLDCGANVECSANDLARFAVMGDVFCKCVNGIDNPRVGLMSVGREPGKGNTLIREAYEKISQLPLNFVGNLEGSDMVTGYANVIVTDGFSGNLLLKCAEAAGKAAMEMVQQIGGDVDPTLTEKLTTALYKRFDFNSQGAATFLGPKKIVVKMHGCANEDTTVASIEQILRLEEAGFMDAMSTAMAR